MRLLFIFLSLLALVSARHHYFRISNSDDITKLESFGYTSGGTFTLNVSDISISRATSTSPVGFLLFPSDSVAEASSIINAFANSDECILTHPAMSNHSYLLGDSSRYSNYSIIKDDVFLTLVFAQCGNGPKHSSMRARVTFKNTNSFLSVGDQPLPAVYAIMASLFTGALVVWIRLIKMNPQNSHRLHTLMGALVAVKVAELVFEAIMYGYLARRGRGSAWTVFFYMFSVIKGVLLVVVGLLAASGWSIIRPYLKDKEKKVMLCAILLQLFANIALVFTDEVYPSQYPILDFFFHLADLIALLAILVPVNWAIKAQQDTYQSSAIADGDVESGDGSNLESGSQPTGAAARARERVLSRLRTLRWFYLWTFAYIYVTRLLIWVLLEGLNYRYTYLTAIISEGITLVYFAYTGFFFRPISAELDYMRLDPSEESEAMDERARGSGVDPGARTGASAAVQSIHKPRATKPTSGSQTVGENVHQKEVNFDVEDEFDFEGDVTNARPSDPNQSGGWTDVVSRLPFFGSPSVKTDSTPQKPSDVGVELTSMKETHPVKKSVDNTVSAYSLAGDELEELSDFEKEVEVLSKNLPPSSSHTPSGVNNTDHPISGGTKIVDLNNVDLNSDINIDLDEFEEDVALLTSNSGNPSSGVKPKVVGKKD